MDATDNQSVTIYTKMKNTTYMNVWNSNVKAARMFGWIRAVLFVTILITHWFSFVLTVMNG